MLATKQDYFGRESNLLIGFGIGYTRYTKQVCGHKRNYGALITQTTNKATVEVYKLLFSQLPEALL